MNYSIVSREDCPYLSAIIALTKSHCRIDEDVDDWDVLLGSHVGAAILELEKIVDVVYCQQVRGYTFGMVTSKAFLEVSAVASDIDVDSLQYLDTDFVWQDVDDLVVEEDGNKRIIHIPGDEYDTTTERLIVWRSEVTLDPIATNDQVNQAISFRAASAYRYPEGIPSELEDTYQRLVNNIREAMYG